MEGEGEVLEEEEGEGLAEEEGEVLEEEDVDVGVEEEEEDPLHVSFLKSIEHLKLFLSEAGVF